MLMHQRISILARTLGQNCLHQSWLVITAESCSGGALAAALTHCPGSSAWFSHSLVTYSNAAKIHYLGVDAELLADQGAVSTACARAMLQGLACQAHQLGLSITGFAGPARGDENHPIGTVFLAWMSPAGHNGTEVLHLCGQRAEIIQQVVYYALRRLVLASLYPAAYTSLNYFFTLMFAQPAWNETCWQLGLAAGLTIAALEPKDNLHLTLAYLGKLKPKDCETYRALAAKICYQHQPFDLKLKQLEYWQAADAYVLSTDSPPVLADLANRFGASATFIPHITLSKGNQVQLKPQALEVTASWTVIGLQLMASWHGVFYLEQQSWKFIT